MKLEDIITKIKDWITVSKDGATATNFYYDAFYLIYKTV